MNYQKIYDEIVKKARFENRIKGQVYYEAHHIIPKCLGGDGSVKQWKTHPNIILLTAREHFLCHWLLCEIYPLNKNLSIAFWSMCNLNNEKQTRYIPSSRIVEISRIKMAEAKIGRVGYWAGKILPDEVKQKIKKTKIGLAVHSEEHKKQLRANFINNEMYRYMSGKKHDDDTKSLMSKSQKKRYESNPDLKKKLSTIMSGKKQNKITCPHCGKIGGNTMNRWHFDNCKNKQ